MSEAEEAGPITPFILAEELRRIGYEVRKADFEEWGEDELSECYDWAIMLDLALYDGVPVTVKQRPEKLTDLLRLLEG